VIDQGCVEALVSREGKEKNECAVMPLKEAVRDLEKRIIIQALVKTGGNKTRAAELLDLSYATLFAKLKEYSIK